MKKLLSIGLISLIALMAACSGGGEKAEARSESNDVKAFLDDICQKGDLSAAWEMLTSSDRAMLGTIPGFYDFMTGKDNEAMPDDMRIAQVVFKEFTPVPKNLINYEVGQPQGQGDTVTVPVTFFVPRENMAAFFKEHISPEVYDGIENMDSMHLTLAEQKALIAKAAKEVKEAVKGKTFELDSNSLNFIVIKEEGKWKISFTGSGFLNAIGGM